MLQAARAEPRASARTDRDLSVETIVVIDDLAAIEPAWRALEASTRRAVFFQSFDWCRFIWRTRRAAPDGAAFDPRIVVVNRGGLPVAIWPLAIRTSAAGRYVQDLTEPYGQYCDILVARDAEVETVMDLALAEIARWRVDGLILRKVRADAALRPWMERRGRTIGTSEAAPAAELCAFEDHDAYRRALNAKTRKNLRNYRNRLSRVGALSHEVIADADERCATIERCFLGRNDWLEASGLTSTAFADPLFSAVVAGLARAGDGAPPVMTMRLALTPAPTGENAPRADVSVQWGFLHNKRYYAYMAARNPDWDAYSAGRLHLEDVVAACAAAGAETVDLLVPAMPYKLAVATSSNAVDGFAIALTVRGRVVIDCWHRLVRPAAKSAVLALPPSLRRWAIKPVWRRASTDRPRGLRGVN